MGRRGPQGNGAATAFDDGAADGESEAEALLRGPECVEQPFLICGRYAAATIANRNLQSRSFRQRSVDLEGAHRWVLLLYGLYRVENKIADDLLNLDTISKRHWQSRCEIKIKRDIMSGDLIVSKLHNIANHLVDIEGRNMGLFASRQPPHPVENFNRPMRIRRDALDRCRGALIIGGDCASQRLPALALISMATSGWLTS